MGEAAYACTRGREASRVVSVLSRASLRVMDEEKREVRLQHLRQCVPVSTPDQNAWAFAGIFDRIMRDALSDLAGGPLPDWPLAKASLPSSLGGLKCSSSLLAYLCHLYCFFSSMQTPNIKDPDPGYTAKPPVHLPDAIICRAVDEASFDALLDSAPNVRSKALALSSALRNAGVTG